MIPGEARARCVVRDLNRLKGTPMRNLAIALSLSVLFVGRGSGQSPDKGDQLQRTFYLTHTATVQQFLEVVTTIRTITGIREVSTDNDQKSATMHATAPQIAMAEWLFNELDSPIAQPALPHEYRPPGTSDDVVRVFYVITAPTVQDFQEVSTLVRTITDTRRVFTYDGRNALVLRGTSAQAALAEWLVKELVPEPPSSTHQYEMAGNDDVVRVLRLPHTPTVPDFQKAATAIREATQIKRIFTYNAPRAMALRGTADQIALAERLAIDLDHPSK
jgi:hypothetical protein